MIEDELLQFVFFAGEENGKQLQKVCKRYILTGFFRKKTGRKSKFYKFLLQ